MLALFSASFIALNNCGNQSASTNEPEVVSEEQNTPAADYAALIGPPITYPVPLGPIPYDTVEINCNNGIDDDGNGWTDCMDINCQVHPECSEWGPPLEEMKNGRSLVLYPNGLLTAEDYLILNTRGVDDDDGIMEPVTTLFPRRLHDCWINPREQDPYSFVALGEPLITSPLGPVGPQLFPDQTMPIFGPRRGLIEECNFPANIMFHNLDDDDLWNVDEEGE